jgi:hypothetical protein
MNLNNLKENDETSAAVSILNNHANCKFCFYVIYFKNDDLV